MWIVLQVSVARGCSYEPSPGFETLAGEVGVDSIPPTPPIVRSAAFERADPPALAVDYETSCGSAGPPARTWRPSRWSSRPPTIAPRPATSGSA